MKKIERRMGLAMSLTMSFILSLAGNLSSGAFTVPHFLRSFVVSFLISLLITTLVPMRKTALYFTEKLGLKPGTIKYRIVEALIMDLLMSPLMTFVMVCIAYRQATAHGAKIPFGPMLLRSEITSFITAFFALFLLTPLLIKIVTKNLPSPKQN